MHLQSLIPLCLVAAIATSTSFAKQSIEKTTQPILFAGTHTRDEGWMVGQGKGVYTYKLDATDGSLSPLGVTPVGVNPVYVKGSTKTFSHDKRVLYAVNAVTDDSKFYPGTKTGYVFALTMRSDGTLEPLNSVESHGGNPTHISLSPDDDFLTVANYDGSLTMFSLNDDGSISNETFHQDFPSGSKVVMDQQATGHIHSTMWIPDTTHLIAANLGSDELLQYNLGKSKKTLGSLEAVKRPPGSGPRHMTMHPNNKFAYVADEISNTVGVYSIDLKDAVLVAPALQNITTLPADFTNKSTNADIHLSGNGQYLYSSNRGHNSIAMFKVDESDGTLTSLGWESSRGETPKSFVIYNDWLIVANQDSNDMQVFKIDSDTGLLHYTGKSYEVGTPESVYIGEF
ncbi:hypothetical protein PHYBOEH_008284 [Phytophthora boehmeriae]|uniref:6-phosphogluconolactonase n=1 Tax=Phytophthora boehmeriae TaxID=109152 RepID=A0A8T1X218_9STRA|nr:hypothetical protein PHYBOEH_008284 [Phytophthora boehmeriae]